MTSPNTTATTPIPVVFVHGLNGAFLDDPSGTRHWLNGKIALGFSTPSLALPLEFDENGKQKTDDLKAIGTLDYIHVLGFKVDVYGKFIAGMANYERPFSTFFYDWRRSLFESVDLLEKYLDDLSTKNGKSKIQVVAHSMGGYVTLVTLNRRPDLFHSVLFAGTPFRSTKYLEELLLGSSIGINRRIKPPTTTASFLSLYSFFSATGASLVDEKRNPIKIDWFNPEEWKKNKLGLYAYEPAPSEQYEKFLAIALEKGKAFKALVTARSDLTYPPIACITGKRHPTKGNILRNPTAKRGYDFMSMRVVGDGTVEYTHMAPPDGIPYKEYPTERVHAAMLNDVDYVKKILAELLLQAAATPATN